MLRISTVHEHERMSTQELLQTIARAVEEGETDFHIAASGQHDIGGPLWNREGKELRFTITNPGQRVGSMCLPGTHILVEGPTPADAGWLNSGGIITIRGDAGDTAAHCSAGGKVYIGGRAGARSGSLMKHDPEREPPELWVLESTGSFSFEFMGGGTAVICGHDSQTLPSVLGDRPCVGMVGGKVYFRGPHGDLPDDVRKMDLDESDIAWLSERLPQFLENIGKSRLLPTFTIWTHWAKLAPNSEKAQIPSISMGDFRQNEWFEQGLFGDIIDDDMSVAPLVPTGEDRLAAPFAMNMEACIDCMSCLKGCPRGAIWRKLENEGARYFSRAEKCIGCGICAAVCPKSIWHMRRGGQL